MLGLGALWVIDSTFVQTWVLYSATLVVAVAVVVDAVIVVVRVVNVSMVVTLHSTFVN